MGEGFQLGPGVVVTGAGVHRANGWYVRKEPSQGPPKAFQPHGTDRLASWEKLNTGRSWYEKDDGCYIFHTTVPSGLYLWYIHTPGDDGNRICRYFRHLMPGGRPDVPPAQEWKPNNEGWRLRTPSQTPGPAPTLRVVDDELISPFVWPWP